MSIDDLLEQRLKDGGLIRYEPTIPQSARVRVVILTDGVNRQLNRTTADEEFLGSIPDLRARLDNFVMGRKLFIGGRENKKCDFKRLDPGADEVWELRKQESPSVRIFGRFIQKDVFFGTNIRSVSWLFKPVKTYFGWNREIRNCKAEWRKYFNTYQPYSGSKASDYISNIRSDSELNNR